ncbi:EamA domain-containing membrane protein RarD [Cohaesibacter sp. ES.047]|uniref:DMT family transporter n=1 Tax=Cohaesibacter sp. ES.047 TaxID=1798205 RepID=UPI000BB68DD9|nr:DMT family transporter [Cohaesibacter sp. ES.047]SNY90823.1 EamA domain-containing membrane protein RarD [Cohaesibacter sp. ES.047]
MSKRDQTVLLRITPLLFVLLWSSGFIGARMGAPYSEPMTFLALRFGIVTVLLLVLAFLLRARWPSPRKAAHAFISGLLIHGLYLGAAFWAIDDGLSAALVALVMGIQPVLTTFFARFVLKERITRHHIIGFVLGLFGILMVMIPRLDAGNLSITPWQIAAAFGAMLSISFGTIYQKRFASKLDVRSATVFQYGAATLLCGSLSFLTETQTIIWSGEFIFALVWLIFVLSIGAIFLLLWMIEHGAVSKVAALFYLVPAVTAILAFLLFDEPITPLQILGIIITATGVLLANRGK